MFQIQYHFYIRDTGMDLPSAKYGFFDLSFLQTALGSKDMRRPKLLPIPSGKSPISKSLHIRKTMECEIPVDDACALKCSGMFRKGEH